MKCIEHMSSEANRPRLISKFRKTERTLLSVFMRALELIPSVRADFLKKCGYGAGLSSRFAAHMEVSYSSEKYPDGRPDGLMTCQYASRAWAAFIEAKADKFSIRTDQIEGYAELASMLGVNAVISISNEFARSPSEPPYHLSAGKRRGRDVFHFAWADIRTMFELHRFDGNLPALEAAILDDCLNYFRDSASGILTYDSMPSEWPKFVQSAGVGVGLPSKTPGITEIVRGW